MRLFHRTFAASAAAIMVDGFRDSMGRYLTTNEYTGVWVSDRPLDFQEGADGDTLLAVDIPEETVLPFEWAEDGKTYREFLVPAALLNQFRPFHILDEEEEDT